MIGQILALIIGSAGMILFVAGCINGWPRHIIFGAMGFIVGVILVWTTAEEKMSEIIIKITKDGDQYCALMGENLQEGIAGFGDDPVSALMVLTTAILDNGLLCNAMIDTLEAK